MRSFLPFFFQTSVFRITPRPHTRQFGAPPPPRQKPQMPYPSPLPAAPPRGLRPTVSWGGSWCPQPWSPPPPPCYSCSTLFNNVTSSYLFMFVDDLCLLITKGFKSSLQSTLDNMIIFGKNSRLQPNIAKSSIVLEGKFQPTKRKASHNRVCQVLGGSDWTWTTAQAFYKAMGEAHYRASRLASFAFSLIERVQLLKVWVLPVLLQQPGPSELLSRRSGRENQF